MKSKRSKDAKLKQRFVPEDRQTAIIIDTQPKKWISTLEKAADHHRYKAGTTVLHP